MNVRGVATPPPKKNKEHNDAKKGIVQLASKSRPVGPLSHLVALKHARTSLLRHLWNRDFNDLLTNPLRNLAYAEPNQPREELAQSDVRHWHIEGLLHDALVDALLGDDLDHLKVFLLDLLAFLLHFREEGPESGPSCRSAGPTVSAWTRWAPASATEAARLHFERGQTRV